VLPTLCARDLWPLWGDDVFIMPRCHIQWLQPVDVQFESSTLMLATYHA
jgi:hypothetical protein